MTVMGSCLSIQARHYALETSNQALVPASSAAASNSSTLASQKLSFGMAYGDFCFGRVLDANCNDESDVIAQPKEVNAPLEELDGFQRYGEKNCTRVTWRI
jgi:hypothetical protein